MSSSELIGRGAEGDSASREKEAASATTCETQIALSVNSTNLPVPVLAERNGLEPRSCQRPVPSSEARESTRAKEVARLQPPAAQNRPLGGQNSVHVISLGAGVQSSTMALMAACGELTPMPAAAIFADTQAEPQSVYKWLSWLESVLPFPVYRVTKGDLTAVALKVREKRDGSGKWAKSVIPTFIKNADGSRGILQRQCTYDYKVLQLVRQSLKLMREHGATHVKQWIGISLEEAHRMKPSRDARITNTWPLIDKRMRRHDCLQWMKANGYPQPPRSACVYCPYHSDIEWRRLRDEEPQEWQRAVQFERDLQATKAQTDNMRGIPFLHSSLVPLDQVDLRTDEDHGQVSLLFGNECEGMCGV